MPIKTTGAEWRAFMADDDYWPIGTWYEEETVFIDGDEAPADFDPSLEEDLPGEVAVRVEGGVVYLRDGEQATSLDAFFRKWRKAQSTARFIVECPKDKLDAVKAAVEAAGGKVTP